MAVLAACLCTIAAVGANVVRGFAVAPFARYRLSFKAITAAHAPVAWQRHILDADELPPHEMSDDGRTTELQMPEGAVQARLRAYCVILESFRVTPSPQAPPHD